MQVDEPNDFASLARRYSAALTRLSDLDIRISASSRLRAYEQRLRQVIEDPRPAVEGELVFALAFDLREIDELIEIVDFLPSSPDSQILKLLRQLQGGGDNPDDEDGTSSREAQYELYLGTVLRRAGMAAAIREPSDLFVVLVVEEMDEPVQAGRLDELDRKLAMHGRVVVFFGSATIVPMAIARRHQLLLVEDLGGRGINLPSGSDLDRSQIAASSRRSAKPSTPSGRYRY